MYLSGGLQIVLKFGMIHVNLLMLTERSERQSLALLNFLNPLPSLSSNPIIKLQDQSTILYIQTRGSIVLRINHKQIRHRTETPVKS